MAVISWGKCNLLFAKHPDEGVSNYQYNISSISGQFIKADTPANGTTSINVTEGEKHEAEIEGGDVEAVKYEADKFELQFDIRRAQGRKLLAQDKNGAIAGTYAFVVQPEDPNAPAILIEAATVKRTPNYSSTDGLTDHYVVSCVAPSNDTNTIKLGICTAGKDGKASGGGTALTQNKVVSVIPAYPVSADGAAGTKFFIEFAEQTAVYS